MRTNQHEGITPAELDTAGLWICTQCGDIHGAPPCPRDGRWFVEDTSRIDPGVRLCACCARVAVPSGSPFASYFCEICGPLIVEINRSLGRLAVPVCGDLGANLAQLPSCAVKSARASATTSPRSFFASQLELLELACCHRTVFLLDRLRLPYEPIPLETFLQEVKQLRHESFHAEAALKSLINDFSEYVIEVPRESPELAARVQRKAREFALGFTREVADRLRAKGPAVVREVAWDWARREVLDVQRLPKCLPEFEVKIEERLSTTCGALIDEAVRDFERVFGAPRVPSAPAVHPRFVAMVLSRPGEEWPDFLPPACPRSAHLVVGLEDAPALPDLPLSVYRLSMDRLHRWWILWADVCDDEGGVSSAPVCWSPRSRLCARDAGFLLLEASLRKDRETHGAERPRPTFGMPGLLDEDLTNVLLDLVWQPDERTSG